MVLRLRLPAPDDWKDAKCLGISADEEYDPFFEDMEEALPYCNGDIDTVVCPVRSACLVFALTNNLKEGVWGGTSEITRKAIRKKWPLRGREPRPEWGWMTEKDALAGLKAEDLIDDEDDDD